MSLSLSMPHKYSFIGLVLITQFCPPITVFQLSYFNSMIITDDVNKAHNDNLRFVNKSVTLKIEPPFLVYQNQKITKSLRTKLYFFRLSVTNNLFSLLSGVTNNQWSVFTRSSCQGHWNRVKFGCRENLNIVKVRCP